MQKSISPAVCRRLFEPAHLAGLLLMLAGAVPSAKAGTVWGGTPVVEPIMPPDSRGNNQSAFNNLAWQQFITLNWLAATNYPGQADTNVPPSAFGTPLDVRPVVWESYKESSEVFRKYAQPPTPWGATRKLPTALAGVRGSSHLRATSTLGIKGLYAQSELIGGPHLDLSEFAEAGTDGAWLTAQPKMNNYITLFEKRLNEDEFNYINQNQLYDAAAQTPFALTNGINLPDGSAMFASYGTVGAIETKAAWIELDDASLWPLFKISRAYVSYPSTNGPTPPRLVTVGLVALHIIRKTPNAQQFAWSTFEHVNNDPSITDIQQQALKAWYTYYNPNCDTNTDVYHCEPNYQPVPGKDPYNAPVQVVRNTPISTSTANNIGQLNTNTWAVITAANPKSVFLNYQLVNVLWPNNNTDIPAAATIPLTDGNATPKQSQQPVASTVLETYHQDLFCLACHTFGSVAATNAVKKTIQIHRLNGNGGKVVTATEDAQAALASDYSFLFGEAQNRPPVHGNHRATW